MARAHSYAARRRHGRSRCLELHPTTNNISPAPTNTNLRAPKIAPPRLMVRPARPAAMPRLSREFVGLTTRHAPRLHPNLAARTNRHGGGPTMIINADSGALATKDESALLRTRTTARRNNSLFRYGRFSAPLANHIKRALG